MQIRNPSALGKCVISTKIYDAEEIDNILSNYARLSGE